MRPRAVGNGSFEQRAIIEAVSENRFEEVQIGNLFGIFQNTVNYKQTPEGCLKPAREAGDSIKPGVQAPGSRHHKNH